MIRRAKTYPPDTNRYLLDGKTVVPCKRCGQPIAWHLNKKRRFWVPLDVRAAREAHNSNQVFTTRHLCWDGTGRITKESTP